MDKFVVQSQQIYFET